MPTDSTARGRTAAALPGRSTRQRSAGAVAAGLLAILALSASSCSDGNAGGTETPRAPATSSTPTPTPMPTKDEKTIAGEKALAVYKAWLDLDWRAINARDYAKYEKRLKAVAEHEALAYTRAAILRDSINKIERRGKPAYSPEIKSVDLSAQKPTVTIVDCKDISNWLPFHQGTKKSARPPGQKLRLPIISTVWLDRGRWVARTSTADKERSSC